jgi:hypothetical protein
MFDLHSKLILWGDLGSLSTVSQQLLDKAGDITSGNRDVLDRGSNNVSLGLQVSCDWVIRSGTYNRNRV